MTPFLISLGYPRAVTKLGMGHLQTLLVVRNNRSDCTHIAYQFSIVQRPLSHVHTHRHTSGVLF